MSRITPTIASRLSKPTVSSADWNVARARTRSLYRTWYRSAPEICSIYALDIPASAMRAKIRQRFDRNRHVQDLGAVDVLLAKSRMEYQEMLNVWKMHTHVMRYFDPEESPPEPVTFMDKFLAGKDENQVRQQA